MKKDTYKNNIITSNNILNIINSFMRTEELEDVDLRYNSKTKTLSMSATKDDYRANVTLTQFQNGQSKKESQFNVNLGREALEEQILELYNNRYNQTEIAQALGISQATVSNYLKRATKKKKKKKNDLYVIEVDI